VNLTTSTFHLLTSSFIFISAAQIQFDAHCQMAMMIKISL
jgi:hypothetical protein